MLNNKRAGYDRKPVQLDLLDAGQNGRQTKRLAYADSLPRLAPTKQRILAFVLSRGDTGATRDEIADRLGIPIQSVCGPVKSQREAGRQKETPKRRPTRWAKHAAVLIGGRNDG
jgi:hypothetical protein